MTEDTKFTGFEQPQENWSKLPHALIDELPNITSESELKVILYILRHTWGYHEDEKRITIDEFCNGRKRKDGSRIDAGCGITPNSVKAGIKGAVTHGYINVEEDAKDKARIKRYYSINSGGQSLTPDHQTLTPRPSNFDPRTEKETLERNPVVVVGQSPEKTGPKKPDMNNLPQPPTLGEINGLWMANIGAIGPIQAEMIADLYTDYGGFEMEVAIKAAVTANARSMNYVQGTLKGRRNGSANHPSQQTSRNGSGRHKGQNGTGRATQPTLSDEDARLMAEWAAANT